MFGDTRSPPSSRVRYIVQDLHHSAEAQHLRSKLIIASQNALLRRAEVLVSALGKRSGLIVSRQLELQPQGGAHPLTSSTRTAQQRPAMADTLSLEGLSLSDQEGALAQEHDQREHIFRKFSAPAI